MKAMKISVALAAYMGEQYIVPQLLSVLSQLGESDEVVVSDDYPDGDTRRAVMSLNDSRIKYIEGPGKGVCPNFEHAMRACTGDVIFLCDQDDVWLPGKVERVMREFDGGAQLVIHDASITDAELHVTDKSAFALHGISTSFFKTLLRNTWPGCCMAFDRSLLSTALPLPGDVPMHDWWIALAAMKKKLRICVITEPLILWRRHGGNVTGGKTRTEDKLLWRLRLIRALSRI